MSSDTVEVDGQEYVFDPREVTKPQKQDQTENEENKVIYESGNP